MPRAASHERADGAVFQSIRAFLRAPWTRAVPERFSLRDTFGGLALLFLLFEILSGILLLAYYRPTAAGAFFSIGILMDEVRLGWLVRSVHIWSAHLVILLTLLHLTQAYFTHAYAAPRQLSWTTGVILLLVLFAFGVTGILLPWDQYAYWATEAARQSIAGIPIVSSLVLNFVWGGWALGQDVLLRFYVFHVAVLPWIVASFLALHLVLTWRSRAGEVPARRRSAASFPEFALTLFIIALLVTGALLSLATIASPPVGDQADPLTPLAHVRPPWYFLPAHQVLRNVSGTTAILVVVVVFSILFLLPTFDGRPIKSTFRRVARWLVGAALIAGCVLLGVRGYFS
jgi:quinol-cytochrome oxidoreductase complex cytochrome b subunit